MFSGLLTAVHKDYFSVLKYRDPLFHDFGDRVAQLLHVELVVSSRQSRKNNIHQQILIVNTHLLFPHDCSYCIVRLRQVICFHLATFLSFWCCFNDQWCFYYHALKFSLHFIAYIGVQDSSVCRSISARAQSYTHANHALWVCSFPLYFLLVK